MAESNKCKCPSCVSTVHLEIHDPNSSGQLKLLEQTMCGVCWRPLLTPEFPILPPESEPIVNVCGHVFHPGCLEYRGEFYPFPSRCPLCGRILEETRRIHVIQRQKITVPSCDKNTVESDSSTKISVVLDVVTGKLEQLTKDLNNLKQG